MKASILRNLAICCAVVGILASCASSPSGAVSAKLHPNLAAAQGFIENAIAKISAAQAANEFDLSGHAAKAKALLNQAYSEIKLAALAANQKK